MAEQLSMLPALDAALAPLPDAAANVRASDPLTSFEAFVTHKLWWGLESSIDDLLNYCRAEPDVQALIRGAVEAAGPVGRPDAGNLRNTKVEESDTATYALRRLKRDNPELAEQVVAGVLSAHAAAVQAGFRKPTWTAPADPERLAEAVERRFPGWKMVRTN